MRQAAIDMKESAIHQMETTGQIALTPSLQETETDRTNQKTPIYRKYVKRREKSETTKHQGTSIQV